MPAAPPSQRLTGSSYPSVSCRGHLRLALGCSKHSDVAGARRWGIIGDEDEEGGAVDAQTCEDIRQLLARYNLAIDLGDADAWVACFTHDGVFRCTGLPDDNPLGGTFEGSDELSAYARTHDGIMKGRARHWNANLLIEGDGDEATMTCYLLALTTGSSIRGSTGIYRDRLRRRNGAWRFAERHIAIDVPPG